VSVTAPSDRRFLRAQVKPGRRTSRWRGWLRLCRWCLLFAAAAGVASWLALAVLNAPALRVDRISVTGNQLLSKGEVLAALEGLRGQNILFVRLDDWRRQVLACPWVAEATIRRSLPRTVEVRIVERCAIAIGRVGEVLFLVDEHGDEIDEYGPRYAEFDLPIIDGLSRGGEQEPGMNDRRVQLASRLLGEVRGRPELARRISQLDVSDPRNAVVLVDQETTRVRLGDERFVERLQSYVDLAAEYRRRVPAIDYVDLRFGERVVVGLQAGATTAPGGQGGAQPAGPPRRGGAPQ
jgi:cell division protein FtsQ